MPPSFVLRWELILLPTLWTESLLSLHSEIFPSATATAVIHMNTIAQWIFHARRDVVLFAC